MANRQIKLSPLAQENGNLVDDNLSKNRRFRNIIRDGKGNETSILQTAEEVSLLASSVTDIDGRVTENKASLTVQAGQIATKVEQSTFDTLSGRVNTAETSIVQNANAITLKASQSSVDDLTGRVSSAEASITTQAGQISLKADQTTVNTVSAVANSKAKTFLSTPTTPYYVGDIWIDTNATTGGNKVCTTERLTGAYVAGDWTKEGVTSRIDSAELKITPTAITSTVRSSTEYTNDLGAKENTVFKQNTAPAHLDGRFWLDTSVTPNVLNRSNGTAWVKATPTQASEVGAYSSSDGTALAGRVTNAETSITQQAGQIALKAEQTTVDTVSAVANSKAKTFLSTPTPPYYVGDIWIETNATTGGNRVCTTERLTGAYVASDWTKEGVTSRMDSAEQKITPTAITSTVRSSTEYTADQNAKENTVFKQNTAPAHVNGRLWLDTSVTPNILYRSNGSAWIKATPTQASEVGAYSSSQGTALEGSLNTAVSINEMTKKNGIELFDQRYVTDITKPPTTVSSGAQSIEPSTVVGLSDNRNIIKTTHSTWLRSDFIPYIQGNPVYMSCKVYNEATSNGILYVGLEFYDSAKVSLGSNDLAMYAISASSTSIPINTWVDLNGFVTPTDSDRAKASFVRVRILTRWSGNQGITYLSHVSVKQLGYNADAQTFERLTTAESSITQNADQIALRVTQTTYNAGIASKENTVIKQTTAPAHLDGRLWLNTSVTPNVLNRSNGTAWIKATPTQASEVGAYSSGQVDNILTDYSTITQTSNSIALEIGKIQVGATNMMRSSSGSNPMGWFVGTQATITYFSNYVRGQGNSATNPSYPRIQNMSTRNTVLDLTKQYTLSFEARANASATRSWTISQSNSANTVASGSVNVTTAWQRFEVTFIPAMQPNSTTDFFIYCGATTGDTTSWLELRDVQLEIGNKATAYKNANNELSTTNYIFDGTNATFRNGGLRIQNNAGTTVFDADTSGNLRITGQITADTGNIADFSLIPNYATVVAETSGKAITAGSGSNRVGMSPGVTSGGFVYSFWAGNDNPLDAPFRVLRNGGLRSSDAIIAGWTMSGTSISRGNMSLNAGGTNGNINFGGATLQGLGSSRLQLSGGLEITGSAGANSGGINNGTSFINLASETTRMNYNGQWTATGVRWGVNGGSALSDLRLKHDIKDIDGSFIFKLRPVEFRYDVDGRDLQFGLIAQEVEELLGDNIAVVKKPNDENEHYGLDYTQLIAPMVATIQHLEKRISELEAKAS